MIIIIVIKILILKHFQFRKMYKFIIFYGTCRYWRDEPELKYTNTFKLATNLFHIAIVSGKKVTKENFCLLLNRELGILLRFFSQFHLSLSLFPIPTVFRFYVQLNCCNGWRVNDLKIQSIEKHRKLYENGSCTNSVKQRVEILLNDVLKASNFIR